MTIAFSLILRLYGPAQQVIEQRWQMPAVEGITIRTT